MEFSTPEIVNPANKTTSLIEILADDRDDDKIKTFILHGEDHSLGNALRWVVMKDKDVQFCGYTVPHPSQREIHFRIQTYKKPAVEVLRTALVRLRDVMENIGEKVKESASQFKASTAETNAMETG